MSIKNSERHINSGNYRIIEYGNYFVKNTWPRPREHIYIMCRCNHFCIILFVPLGERVKGNLQILTFGALRGGRPPRATGNIDGNVHDGDRPCVLSRGLYMYRRRPPPPRRRYTSGAAGSLTRQHVRFASPQQFVISKSASFIRQTKFERDPLGINEFREDVTMELEEKKPRP